MTAAITELQLENASSDADSLSAFVTSTADSYTTRTGFVGRTLNKIDRDVTAAIAAAPPNAIQIAKTTYFANSGVSINETGTLTTSPLAPLHVGTGTTLFSSAAKMIVCYANTTNASYHGFAANTTHNIAATGATVGLCAFDARERIIGGGSVSLDHAIGYQCITTWDCAGSINDIYGGESALTYSAGLIDKWHGWSISAPFRNGGGTLNNIYGIDIADLTGSSATADCYAIRTLGLTKSLFGGSIGIGADPGVWGFGVDKGVNTNSGNHAKLGLLAVGGVPYNSYPSVGYNLKNVSGAWKYDTADVASKITFGGGTDPVTVSVAPAGSAGAAISWSDVLKVNDKGLLLPNSVTPASSSATGITGQIVWDSSYVYVCVAANTWKRTALATW